MSDITIVKKRDTSLDFVKVVATLLVLNSHMEICFPNYEYLATGGSIGDALFFFVSGYGLFLGSRMDFFNWYKRRIKRIFPAIISMGLIANLIFGVDETFWSVMSAYKYWFIRAILVLYVFLYPLVMHPAKMKGYLLFSLGCLLVMYVSFFNYEKNGIFYGVDNYFRWIVFFPTMVIGGCVCSFSDKIQYRWYAFPALLVCVAMFYGILYYWGNSNLLIISIFPLNMIPIFLYMTGKSPFLQKIWSTPILGRTLLVIGTLCLESYLIQGYILTDRLNEIFPLSVIILFIAVFSGAYILKCLSNLFLQVFESKPLSINGIFKI